MVKFNVIAGEENLGCIECDLPDILAHDYKKLKQYIEKSLAFKRQFIEEDEFDHGVRVLLNYAHTFGHAFEVSSRYAIPHGSAVAIGMMTANNVSVKRSFIDEDYSKRIENVCCKIVTNIHFKKEWFDDKIILDAIRKDKKQTSKEITAVLIQKDYSLGVYRDIKESEIIEAVKDVLVLME